MNKAPGSPSPSAVGGGVFVLVVTAFAAFTQFSDSSPAVASSYVWAALILLLLGAACLLARFIAKHGDEIGEARFDTRNHPDSDVESGQ